jgi:outer membrane protein assembly factor BamA
MISRTLPIFFILFVSSNLFAQTTKNIDSIETDNPCFQKQPERFGIIKKADLNSFVVRRIEITGNTRLRDSFFREKFAFQPGDVFSKRLLDKSILNFNKLKQIKPITMNNVRARIDSQNQDIDLLVCVVEKPRLN